MISKADFAEAVRGVEGAVRAGEVAHAQDLLRALSAKHPAPHPQILRLEAIVTTQEARYDDAVRLWQACHRESGLSPGDALKYGKALETCGDIPGAIAVYRAIPVVAGIEHRGLLAEASLHSRLGNLPASLERLDAAVAATAGSRLEAQARRTRARQAVAAGRLLDALTDFTMLERIAPADPAGLSGQIDVHLRNRDTIAAGAVLAIATARHPDAGIFREQAALLVNQRGDEADLVAFLAGPVTAGLADETFRLVLAALCSGRLYHFSDALCERLASAIADPGKAKIARAYLADREMPDTAVLLPRAEADMARHRAWPDSPAGIRARGALAIQFIGADRAAEALAIADGLAATIRTWPYPPPVLGQLLEWAMVRRGAVADAQRSYWVRRRMIAARDRSDELQAVRTPGGRPPPVVVFCQLRNEMTVLPAFFRHYRAIGIERFVMIDNGSTDGSLDWLAAQGDVELFRTNCPFRRAEAGNAWTNPLIARPAFADTLCLRVDADEHLVYPHCEGRPITALWRHMRHEGAEALAGFMLDMLPERLDDLAGAGTDFTRIARYFDPPPRPTPTVGSPYVRYLGGPRSRLLAGKPQHLTKCSGLRGGGTIEQVGASHRTSPARVSTIGMVLLHYKFRPDFFARARRVAGEHQYSAAAEEYVRYRLLEDRSGESLLGPETREYTGSASLLAHGVLRSTAAWDTA